MAAQSAKHELSEPIEYDGKTYAVLRFGKLRNKHLKFIPDEMFELSGLGLSEEELANDKDAAKLGFTMLTKMTPLIAAMAEVPSEVIDELPLEDLQAVAGIVTNFLGGSPTNTKK